MRKFLGIFLLITGCQAWGQDSSANHFDTLWIRGCHSSKIVQYDLGQATIYMDYKEFMRQYKPFWKMYKKGMHGIPREIRQGYDVNPDYLPRGRAVDSMYNYCRTQVKISDTIVVDPGAFYRVGIGSPVHFDSFLDDGNCDLRDGSNRLQKFILRRKATHSEGWNQSWGGRLYFIPGERKYFYGATDWVS